MSPGAARRPAIWVAGMLVLVALLAVFYGIRALDPQGRAEEGETSNESLGLAPTRSEYRHIPLPTEPPPAGAYVRTGSYANPDVDGETIMFQYPEFTVGVCSISLRTGHRDACMPQKTQRVIRREVDHSRYTVFVISSKGSIDTPQAAQAQEFFATAQLQVRPPWMNEYVQTQLDNTLGSS